MGADVDRGTSGVGGECECSLFLTTPPAPLFIGDVLTRLEINIIFLSVSSIPNAAKHSAGGRFFPGAAVRRLPVAKYYRSPDSVNDR